MRLLFVSLLSFMLALAGFAADAPIALKAVGVLGNTSGLSDRPVPYSFYTGIAADARGRLYLAGADEGIAVCDQDGKCLTVLQLPDGAGLVSRSLMVRAGDAIFFVALNPYLGKSALYRIQTTAADASKITIENIAKGPGIWAISPTLDKQGRIIVGQSNIDAMTYPVIAVDPVTAVVSPLFILTHPKGATRPWRHIIQVDPDNNISIQHAGGVNWYGRYSQTGDKVGDAIDGMIMGDYRYYFGYSGGLRRMDITGTKPAPGDCGSGVEETRMAAQMVQVGDRYFFAGRSGAVEAKWNGTNFIYTRRIGAISLEELIMNGNSLHGIAFTAGGNNDVQHPVSFAKEQPIGELLDCNGPLHGKNVITEVPAIEGRILLYRNSKGFAVGYDGTARHLDFEVNMPDVKSIGQAAIMGKDIAFADPTAGTIWRRPLMDKTALPTAWKTEMPGVLALAVTQDGVYIATAKGVSRLSLDGQTVTWKTADDYKGIRRIAATMDYVYVCDTAGNIVDQLNAKTGALIARLGVTGEKGCTLDRLNRPYAIAADLNGVYIADNGNGRIVIATTTMWKPDIRPLPREDNGPITAVKITIKPPFNGRMSLNIYDQNDVTVRQLVSGQPSSNSVIWDGRDMYSHWAKPGTYKYHGIIAPKFSLKYVGSVGQSGNPAYRTADGTGSWGGVWGYVMDICTVNADANSDILVLWAFEEGEGGLIRMTQDGKVIWKSHLDWWLKGSQAAVACDGTSVYIVCDSAMDAPEGQSNYGGDTRRPLLWRVDAATGKQKLYAPSQQSQPMFGEYIKGDRIATDLAFHDGKLYLTAPKQNALYVIDPANGKATSTWKLDGVSGVTFDANGGIFVGMGSKIAELLPDGTVKRQLADADGPVWDIDTVVGGGFVASVGAPRNQVVYFDKDGKETRALGKRGGRPLCGKMQPENFLDPVGICNTGGNTLFIAESTAPKRFTRWSSTGKLEREFQGPYYYSGMFGVDDEKPEYIYGDTHGDIIRYIFNYTTGTWAVDSYWIGVYNPATGGDGSSSAKWWPRIRWHDGKIWWCSGSGAIVELNDDNFRFISKIFANWVIKQDDGSYKATNKNTGIKGTWSDINGDGKMQADEWKVTTAPGYPISGGGPQQGWGMYFDDKFDLYMHDWSDNTPGGIWKIPAMEWKNGVPVYDWEKAVYVAKARNDGGANGLAHGSPGCRTAYAAGGAVYGFNGGYNAAGLPGVGHGHDWEFAQVTKYDPATGKPIWHAGERADGFAAPGQTYCPTGPAGIINNYLFWCDENSLVHAWDVDHGLYVDTLLEDTMRGPVPNAYSVWVELFNTRIFRHPQTGKVYLMAASDAIHVYEVLGTDVKAVPFLGTFTLTAEDIESAKQQYEKRTAPRERTLGIPLAKAPVTIDGDLTEFDKSPFANMVISETAQGNARMLYDDKNLYVAFDVKDDSPWKNAGGDTTALFKTGDEVSVWIGKKPGKRPVDVGDIRILFAPDGDKVKVVAYRPKVAAGAKPVSFRSPSGEVRMDKVEIITDVTAAVKITDRGYRLEAAIPWTTIGLDAKTEKFGLDFSINFSDPAGQRNVARMHWARNGAEIVYDLPTEARLDPVNWGWGLLK
ncbi:MAG: sugar-binding protein [bacterium]